MARYSGLVGYVTQEETVPGVYSPVENTKLMRGNVLRETVSQQADRIHSGNKVNSDITLGHRVSLVGDAYAFGNYYNIKWIELDAMKWEVNSIELQRPRIIVSLGGLWNA